MANEYKILGQSKPAALTLTTIYTVPAGKSAVVSDIGWTNQAASDDAVRVSLAQNGAADDPKQYLYYDLACAPGDAFAAQRGWSLGAGDQIRVYSRDGSSSFTVTGVEIS